jgi:hypothetical protein
MIPPARITAKCPPSKPPIVGRLVVGSMTASATAARIASTAKAYSIMLFLNNYF